MERCNDLTSNGSAFDIDGKGLSTADVVAYIDPDANDLPMLDISSICIAMANSTEEVKQRTKDITNSNNQYGVARAIKNKHVN